MLHRIRFFNSKDNNIVALQDAINITMAIGLAAAATFLPSCGRNSSREPSLSRLADVTLYKPINVDFDYFELRLEGKSSGTSQFFTKGTPSDQTIKATVNPGEYKINLSYFKGGTKTYGSDFCPNGVKNEENTLKPGSNTIELKICDQAKKPTPTEPPPQNPPSPIEPPSGNNNSSNNNQNNNSDQSNVSITPRARPSQVNKTFTIRGSQLIDPTGNNFLIRGVNNPHNYWPSQSYDALPRIKELGFNTVRIVWCADNLVTSGRCDQKDIRPISELEKILGKMRELQLVGVLNLQNATGSSDPKHLDLMADYLVKPEVKQVLLAYQDMLLINVANEWYGQWDKSRTYVDSYQKVIQKIRRSQLPHVLVVDARGWGQDFSSIAEHGAELKGMDSNLMISAHMYEVFDTKKVSDSFAYIRQNNIPFIVGEFGCSHGSSKMVACQEILKEAARSNVGLIAWSFSGNSEDLKDLNIVEQSDWKTLTPFGKLLLNQSSPFKQESKTACLFNRTGNCQ